MTTPNLPAPSDGAAFTNPAALALSVRELRAWEAQAARQVINCPRPDDECWEDTEIDVRRTVL